MRLRVRFLARHLSKRREGGFLGLFGIRYSLFETRKSGGAGGSLGCWVGFVYDVSGNYHPLSCYGVQASPGSAPSGQGTTQLTSELPIIFTVHPCTGVEFSESVGKSGTGGGVNTDRSLQEPVSSPKSAALGT